MISKKIQLPFFELFSVGPAMNLRYHKSSLPTNLSIDRQPAKAHGQLIWFLR